MRITVVAVVIVALGLTAGAAVAGDFANYTNTSRINAMASDASYVWLGTFGGLKRYNKATGTWTTFTTADGLPDNWVYCLLLRAGRLWVGTQNGMCYTDNNGTSFSAVIYNNNVITSMTSSTDTLWVAAYQMVGGYNAAIRYTENNGGSWTDMAAQALFDKIYWAGDTLYAAPSPDDPGTFPSMGLFGTVNYGGTWIKNPIITSEVYSIARSGQTFIVATWGNGVYSSTDNAATWVHKNRVDGIGSDNCYDVAISPGYIWLACSDSPTGTGRGGISRSTDSGATWTNSQFVNGLNNMFAVWVDGVRTWGGSAGGGISLSVDNGASWTTYTAINGVGDVQPNRAGVDYNLQGSINAYDVDVYSNIIWAACTPGGLSKSTDNGASWTTYTTLDGLPDTSCQAVSAGQNAIFVGTASGMAKSTNSTTWSAVAALAGRDVRCILQDGDTVYVGTTAGLRISSDKGATWSAFRTTAQGLGADTVNGIAAQGDTVWLATTNGLAYSTNGGVSFTNFTTVQGLPMNFVYDVAMTMDTVWVACPSRTATGGVAKAAPPYTTWTTYAVANGFDTNNNYCLRIDGETVWVGSSGAGGVTYTANDGASWTKIKASNGLIENYIYGIDVDGNFVYFGAKNGVCRFNKKSPEAHISSPRHGQALTTANVAIIGNAIDYENISAWTLAYAAGVYPNQGAFTTIGAAGSANVTNSLLRSWDVSQLTSGYYTLRLRVTDGTSVNDEYMVINVPLGGAVGFTAPTAGEEVGGVITVTVTASDSDGVAAVDWQYSVDSTDGDNGAWTAAVADSGSNPDSTAPYSFRWQTLPASGKDGMVWLRARLLDNLGFYSSWAKRVIAVNNQAVDPTIQNTVTSTDQNASLYLPPNALSSATVVTLSRMSAVSDPPEATITAVGVGFEIYPDNTTLAKPGTLTVKWTDAEAVGFTESAFALYGWNSTTSLWEKIGGTLNTGSNTLTTAITNFRQYAVMEDRSGAGVAASGVTLFTAQPRVFSPSGGGFSDHLDISFTLGTGGAATIKIYGLNGRLARAVVENRDYPAGSNVVTWDGKDEDGEYVANGLYIVTITAGGTTLTKTVVMMNK